MTSSRWKRARSDTQGFRAWKRELLGGLLGGALTYVSLRRFGSPQSASDEVIVIAVGMLVFVILIPLVELLWNFIKAPIRIAHDEIRKLAEENQQLRSQLEVATGWKGIGRRKLQEFWDRGDALRHAVLEAPDVSEPAHQQFWAEFTTWRNELLSYVHGLSPSKAGYIDDVKVMDTPIYHDGKPLVGWKAETTKHIAARLERIKDVMRDYPSGQ